MLRCLDCHCKLHFEKSCSCSRLGRSKEHCYVYKNWNVLTNLEGFKCMCQRVIRFLSRGIILIYSNLIYWTKIMITFDYLPDLVLDSDSVCSFNRLRILKLWVYTQKVYSKCISSFLVSFASIHQHTESLGQLWVCAWTSRCHLGRRVYYSRLFRFNSLAIVHVNIMHGQHQGTHW